MGFIYPCIYPCSKFDHFCHPMGPDAQALGNMDTMPRGIMRWNPASKGAKYPQFEALWVPWLHGVRGKTSTFV